jgi:hypothetical protein
MDNRIELLFNLIASDKAAFIILLLEFYVVRILLIFSIKMVDSDQSADP